jgi:hypothetical protein
MPAGLLARTPTGNIQITNDLVNFGLVAKGTATLGATRTGSITGMTWTSGQAVDILVPNTLGYPPILAIVASVPLAIFDSTLVGGNWRCTLVAEYDTAPGAITIEWFAFGEIANAPPAHFTGLAVYRPDGRLVFKSDDKPMRVVGFIQSETGSSVGGLPGGRKYAVAHVQQYMQITAPIPAGTWSVYHFNSAVVAQTNGAQVTTPKTVDVRYSSQPSWSGNITYPGYRYLVLDVTGY